MGSQITKQSILVLLAIIAVAVPPALAQQTGPLTRDKATYLAFEIVPATTFQFVGLAEGTVGPNGPLPKDVVFRFSIFDRTIDSTTLGQSNPTYHSISFDLRWADEPAPVGWQLNNIASGHTSLKSGDRMETQFQISHDPSTVIKEVHAKLIANLSLNNDPSQYTLRNETFVVRVYPSPGLQVFVERPPDKARPNKFVTIPVRIENTDLYPQQVNVALKIAPGSGVNPENIPILGTGPILLEPLEVRFLNLTFRTPKEQAYYGSTSMGYTVAVQNIANPGINQATTRVLIIEGWYLGRQILLIIPIIIILTILLVYLIVAARRFYNERVLGKPMPPWRIPHEADQLAALRKSEPKEFYLRRYFFMEEEYQSALNWFYSFKKRTKRQLAAQASAARYEERAMALTTPSVARFDRRAERITQKFRARQDRQRLKLEAKRERLQAKVDQHYEEDFDKDHEKWQKKVEKIKKKANKPWYRAHKKWEAEVAKINKEWEKPFRKDREAADKQRAKALEKYEKQVKKKDKDAWRDWREAVENAERENRIRKKEGREPTPLPELFSKEVGAATLPPSFKAPPRPKLPPEPKEPTNLELPPEPELVKPQLDTSHYAGKARRAGKKTDRKVRRLERKLERALAKNERDRVRALAKADRKRNKLIDKRKNAFEPSMTARILHQTPEHREYRARRSLMRAMAKERVKQAEESEKGRLEVLRVDAERREAELFAKLVRDRSASVRSGASPSGMRMEPDKDPSLVSLRSKNQAQLERERRASQAKLKAEEARIHEELRAGLTEELIKERARSRPPAASKETPAKPKK